MKKQDILNNIILAKLENIRYRTAPIEMQNLLIGDTVTISEREYVDIPLPTMYSTQKNNNTITVDQENNTIVIPQENVGFASLTMTLEIITNAPDYFYYIRTAFEDLGGGLTTKDYFVGETKGRITEIQRNAVTYHAVLTQYNTEAPTPYHIQITGNGRNGENTGQVRIIALNVKQIPRANA